ncbi:uncharacterized protein LOC119686107 [Teleopsis dalmanni]|uniref:uncharacterized protein LOC119679870 n=1 Tax=Teleopsis dalmanni TaxID=139649 RepID=UPI0018CE79F2|nr:uncharacterized protein LOC119679870 [Teleopsis dalmanni]XP_037956499.1 uncharacterized protein LOC119686107 [Teleopsis dalmanni]
MVSKLAINNEVNVVKDRPVFIPPRKRQSSKKTNGAQNYVDHIVNVQHRQKLSPSNPGLEEDLLKTSLILKNKQPLPQIPGIATVDTNIEEKSVHSLHQSTKSSQSVDNIYEDDNELRNFDNSLKPHNHHFESSTVTPTSFSESSLDVKLSKSHDCLSNRSASKKRVNIHTDLPTYQLRNSPRLSPEIANYEDVESGETSVLNIDMQSLERFNTRRSMDSNYLTMTGTIKRGRKKGQNLDLQINISREELEQINATAIATEVKKKQNLCFTCSLNTGLHILLLSLVSLPFVTIISSIYSFYIGTLTWYNMFSLFNEEKSYLHRVFMSPILIIAYPVGIILCTVGLGIYAGIVQISLQFNSWLNEVADIEKGFYGWLCSFLHMSDCSPYEVIILTDIRLPNDEETQRHHVNTSTEELSL